jgi:hypothetical protein
MSMQYVSEKVVGRYIRRLRNITCVSTISIIILASYLYVLIVLLGSLAKFLRCLVEIITTVHTDYSILLMYVGKISWWMSQNVSKKEYLDTYLKEIPRMSALASIFRRWFSETTILYHSLDFPHFDLQTDGETERRTEICRTDIGSYPERDVTPDRRRVPPRAPEISVTPKHWGWRPSN